MFARRGVLLAVFVAAMVPCRKLSEAPVATLAVESGLAATPAPSARDETSSHNTHAPLGVRDARWGQEPPSFATPLEAYRFTAQYPPTSRPLGPGNVDLLEPNRRHETPRPGKDAALRYLFTADKYFVVGDEPLTASLTVFRDDEPVSARIRQAFAAEYVPGTLAPASERHAISFTPQGEAYAAELRPAALGDSGETRVVGVYVEFEAEGAAPEQAMFVVEATPAVAIPARFTGQFREDVVEGSLLVEAGVEVSAGGYYLVDANLYDRRGRPVAWSRFKGELQEGRVFVPLSFFGKVLVDSQAEGPFALGELRGRRHVAGREPESDLMPAFKGRFETRAHALAEFSPDEWDSPEKRARLARLEERFGDSL